MSERIAEAVANLKNSISFSSLDEAGTKQGIVLRLLSLAGWDTFDLTHVVPEYSVGGGRVDYALKLESTSKVFIEVKRPSEDLEQHQQQLLDYCFQQGVRLAVLTNGRTWWLYLPLREGSWEQRRFVTIDLESQEPEVVNSRFTRFLSRDQVESGKAVEAAEELLHSRQRDETIRETIAEAWNEIIETPDELLVELIAETTERICGFKPDSDAVGKFLARHLPELQVSKAIASSLSRAPTRSPAGPVQVPKTPSNSRRAYTGTKPTSFAFGGDTREVGAWIDVVVGLCEILHTRQRREFDKILGLRGRNRPYLSRDGSGLRKPLLLEFAGIYVERNLSANAIMSLCNNMIKLFGHSEDSLKVDHTSN